MADNTTPIPGGDTIATDDIGGVKYQRVKNVFGADGVAIDVSSTNPMPVTSTNGVVSAVNSSTANLAASAVFTGTSEDLTDYATVAVSIFSSHVSATDGLQMQQSPDGTNWDQIDAFTIPAATGKTFQAAVIAKYFRVLYTNGGTLTTSFRLQTLFSKAVKRGSAVRPQDARANDNDFEEGLAFLMGYNGTSWDRLRSSVANGLLVQVSGHPTATGQTASANSLPVVLANDQLTSITPLENALGLPIRQVPTDSWRTSFSDVGSGLLAAQMITLKTGSGQAVSQAVGNLVVTSGTTANAETLIRSVRTFRGQFIERYRVQLSQRIANNAFSIELADIVATDLAFTSTTTTVVITFPSTNPFSTLNIGQFANLSSLTGTVGVPGRWAISAVSGLTVTFTVVGWTAGSGTLLMWGWNYYKVQYDGTVVTTASFDTQRKGWNSGAGTITTNSTANPGHSGLIQGNANFASYSDSTVLSNTGYQFTTRGTRVEGIPEDDQDLYVFIRVQNGTAAPATTTTFTVGFVAVEQTGNNKVYIGGADQFGSGYALGTQVLGGTLASITTVSTVSTVTTVGTVNTVSSMTPVASTVTTNTLTSAASTNATSVKTSAGNLYSVVASNTGGAAAFLKLYNKASAPTVGTDVPVLTIPIAASGVAQVNFGAVGHRFATGIAYAITNLVADSDTTAIAAAQVKVMIEYV